MQFFSFYQQKAARTLSFRRQLFLILKTLSDFHPQFTQHVLPAAVAAIGPKAVIFCVLNKFGVAGGEQRIANFWMLLDFGPQGPAHDLYLDLLPIGADGHGAAAPQSGGDHGRGSQADALAVTRIKEFLGLKVVLAGGPGFAIQQDRMG